METTYYIKELQKKIKNGVNRKTAQREILAPLEVEESFIHFKNKYKKCINRIFEVLFDESVGIDICKRDKQGVDIGSYQIYTDEFQFFTFIVSEYNSVNYKNFINRKFYKVSDEYISMLLCGAKIVVENHKITVSDDILQNWMKLKMSRYQKRILDTYQNLYNVMSDILNLQLRMMKYDVNLIEEFHNCIELLDTCATQFEITVDELLNKRSSFFNSPDSTKKASLVEIKKMTPDELVKYITEAT